MRRKTTLLLCLLSLISSLTSLKAQPRNYDTGEILLLLKKLNTLGSVLYIAAHPDDENTRMITYFAQKENLDVAYLSLTRGDGGQNLIGTEQGALLGLIRTQELLAARRIDGGVQFFTRANDFGFSKTHTETLQKWNELEVLEDMVYVIRKFKPDVILTRFPPLKYNYDTHGHHSASAHLAEKAFDMAANPALFPEQLNVVETWQAKRLYWNTSTWFYQQSKTKLDTTDKITVDAGEYIPELGESVTEIAARSRSKHKSQGFGAAEQRGSEIEYLEFVKGVQAKKNLFEDIDITWKRVQGSDKVAQLLKQAYNEFDAKNKTSVLQYLLEAYQLLSGKKDFWSINKLEEVKEAISAVCGIFLESAATDFSSTAEVQVKTTAINRSQVKMQLNSITYSNGFSSTQGKALQFNKPEISNDSLLLISSAISQPYWLSAEQMNAGMYPLPDATMRALPENFPAMQACFNISINGVAIEFCRPVAYKWVDRVKGEIYRPFVVAPDRTIHPHQSVLIFSEEKSQEIMLTVKAWKDSVAGEVAFINLPAGWKTEPASIPVTLAKKGEERELKFLLTPAAGSATTELHPAFKPITQARYDINYYSRDFIELAYDHIPYQVLFPKAKIKVIKLDIKMSGTNIAYIKGAGDEVGEGLEHASYNVKYLTKENLPTTNLSQFNAILIGIRAYNTEQWLPHQKEKLMDYVKNGGNLIVQYQTTAGLLTNDFGPYPFKIGRGRVTVEEAPMTMMNPAHPIFNFPNKLTSTDFEGWVQERGLYFASEWDSSYVPLFACNDPNEEPLKGSTLLADYGKGVFIYTGISFFRQLPAGVPGAYRLLGNMIGYEGKGK